MSDLCEDVVRFIKDKKPSGIVEICDAFPNGSVRSIGIIVDTMIELQELPMDFSEDGRIMTDA